MKGFILKILINSWLKNEWDIIGYEINIGVDNICIIEKCDRWPALMIIIYKIYRENGTKRTISKVKDIMDIAESFEKQGWRIEFSTDLNDTKKKINHYLTIVAATTEIGGKLNEL